MATAQQTTQTQPDIDLLELIRKTIYGNNINPTSFDFNNIFSPPSSPEFSMEVDSAGSNAGPNPAIGNADPAIGTAISGLAISGIIGLLGVPGLSTVVGKAVNNSQITNIQTILDAIGLTSFEVDQATAVANAANTSIAFDQAANAAVGVVSGLNPDGTIGEAGVSVGDDAADSADSGVGAGSSGSAGDAASAGVGGGGFHQGGFVPGPRTGDKVNIKVEGGEFVVPSSIVDMLGRNFFEKILLTESPLLVAAEKASKESSKG